MVTTQVERIEHLRSQLMDVSPEYTVAEAVRKTLLSDFIQMLANEDGSRTGDDIENVHDMRVATRRMRSILQLLGGYFKTKVVDQYQASLRKIARALGGVRDLDVMIDNLEAFQATLNEDQQAGLEPILDNLKGQRTTARARLVKLLEKPEYSHFADAFSVFLTTPGAGARSNDSDDVAPMQVRHVIPAVIYDHLGAVRAYDNVLPTTDHDTLHALRVEFKRLRYLVAMFEGVLGSSARDFVKEIKAIQDHLGELNDAVVAQATLNDLSAEFPEEDSEALVAYLTELQAREAKLMAEFPQVWKRFNSKTVQRHLANAIASL